MSRNIFVNFCQWSLWAGKRELALVAAVNVMGMNLLEAEAHLHADFWS